MPLPVIEASSSMSVSDCAIKAVREADVIGVTERAARGVTLVNVMLHNVAFLMDSLRTAARKLQTCTFEGRGLEKHTKIQRGDPQREKKRAKFWAVRHTTPHHTTPHHTTPHHTTHHAPRTTHHAPRTVRTTRTTRTTPRAPRTPHRLGLSRSGSSRSGKSLSKQRT